MWVDPAYGLLPARMLVLIANQVSSISYLLINYNTFTYQTDTACPLTNVAIKINAVTVSALITSPALATVKRETGWRAARNSGEQHYLLLIPITAILVHYTVFFPFFFFPDEDVIAHSDLSFFGHLLGVSERACTELEV